jgi:hypothetical protein
VDLHRGLQICLHSETLLHRTQSAEAMPVEVEDPFLFIVYGLILLTAVAVNVVIYQHLQVRPPLPPVFPNNASRDTYLTLLSSSEGVIPSYILRAALLLRAKECVSRLRTLQRSKSSTKALLQQESPLIPLRFLDMMRLAERQLRKEVSDICHEAYLLGGNEWRNAILDQANECWQREKMERTLLEAQLGMSGTSEATKVQAFWSPSE